MLDEESPRDAFQALGLGELVSLVGRRRSRPGDARPTTCAATPARPRGRSSGSHPPVPTVGALEPARPARQVEAGTAEAAAAAGSRRWSDNSYYRDAALDLLRPSFATPD